MHKSIWAVILLLLFLLINGILLAILWLEIDDFYNRKKSFNSNSLVKHKLKELPKTKELSYKYSIYLTSDDGPVRGSEYLNEIILRQKIPITVFLVGQRVHHQSKVSQKLIDYRNNKYVLLANHSFSHANAKYKKFYANPENVVNDFLKNEYYLNIDSQVGRLAGRNIWAMNGLYSGKGKAVESAKILEQQFSYKIYGWDYEIKHYQKAKVSNSALKSYSKIKSLLKNNKTYVKNNIVILMHDQMFRIKKSRKFLEKLILLLRNDKDCQLKFINKYPSNML